MAKECLLIDDDIDDQEIFLMGLQQAALPVKYSALGDPVAALEKLSSPSYKPDYIFLDINMPKMDGLECLVKIKSFQHLKKSRVIMYSTSSDNATIRKCKELGADEFLAKVVSLKQLAASLGTILDD